VGVVSQTVSAHLTVALWSVETCPTAAGLVFADFGAVDDMVFRTGWVPQGQSELLVPWDVVAVELERLLPAQVLYCKRWWLPVSMAPQ